MSQSRLIGIFGGTFDPIHNGHIHSVESLLDELSFDFIHLLPSAVPPHRSPAYSSSEHRLKMTELAVTDQKRLIADNRESTRPGKSYTIDTLKSFRREFPDDALAFILGMDAFLDICNWKDWQQYTDYSHIVVMRRPGFSADKTHSSASVTDAQGHLHTEKNGLTYFARSRQVDISSTEIRKMISSGHDASEYLPKPVLDYIRQFQLYAHT